MRRVAPLALLTLATPILGAQVTASLDLSASDIRYDLFQSSTALSLSPTLAFDRGWTSIAVSGTLLEFESGHRDMHGSLVGSTFTPSFGPLRLELGGDFGASRYRSLAAFSHAFGTADLHYLTPRHGAWLGASGGPTSFGGVHRGAASIGLGLWGSVPWATLTITAGHSAIGDTSYTDVEGAARVNQGRVEFMGRVGDRLASTGGGHGVYGEASVTFAVTRMVNVMLGGGRYPTDPTRGTIAGRYATLGVRLATPAPRPADPYREVLERYQPLPSADSPVTAGIEIGTGRVLRVRADGARKIEVRGDFTDWEPVEITTAGLVLTPGPHLVEVRVDGGPWMVPVGATAVKDEFGGEAGLIVVP